MRRMKNTSENWRRIPSGSQRDVLLNWTAAGSGFIFISDFFPHSLRAWIMFTGGVQFKCISWHFTSFSVCRRLRRAYSLRCTCRRICSGCCWSIRVFRHERLSQLYNIVTTHSNNNIRHISTRNLYGTVFTLNWNSLLRSLQRMNVAINISSSSSSLCHRAHSSTLIGDFWTKMENWGDHSEAALHVYK